MSILLEYPMLAAYRSGIEKLASSIEDKPTRKGWEYSRKHEESVAYLDSGVEGALLAAYAEHMGISLNHAAQIIIWKFEQYQSVMPILEKARNDVLEIVEGVDAAQANLVFESILEEVRAVEQSLADPVAS